MFIVNAFSIMTIKFELKEIGETCEVLLAKLANLFDLVNFGHVALQQRIYLSALFGGFCCPNSDAFCVGELADRQVLDDDVLRSILTLFLNQNSTGQEMLRYTNGNVLGRRLACLAGRQAPDEATRMPSARRDRMMPWPCPPANSECAIGGLAAERSLRRNGMAPRVTRCRSFCEHFP